ncbi:PREDICTED: interactor of constitutive active ROPs 4-like [Ipomoea nil]|uniref:interactor of constitutive active ROPs 4-like n=1 Tax=Ipomoea nil TaxID=35883 RepID=UPI0009014B46|nr:PREDICTED: interactor of constitutive active ROPs 4-like [Ipomoea nil]XP_019158758.1 PREDICTED: interactor of constitutive active ROPs 4-like [Ipomoea nil]
MPRSRGSEMPQRQSPRAPSQLRTSSSDSDSSHHRAVNDRSPKPLSDRRSSPRSAQSDASSQKKLGARITDLESQLGKAQEELRCLKVQLASAESAKKAAQELLEKKTKKPTENQESGPTDEETDVFEISMEPKPKSKSGEASDQEEASYENPSLKNDELDSLRAKLEAKEKELEKFSQENKSLNLQAKAKEEETALKLNQVIQELEATKSNEARINEKLDATEKAKEELEAEMKKLRVQTEQWRKAADAAAAVLAGGADMNEGRISERCGSMDKQYNSSVFESAVGGYGSYLGSPGLIGETEDFGSGKRRSSGIKMFDLWKKKTQK